jgi:hypothetical protein
VAHFLRSKRSGLRQVRGCLAQVAAIEDFWRYTQNMPPTAWLPIMESEILRITHRKHFCRDCGAVAITRPERRCTQCQKARRLETYQRAKQRARVKQRMRKCPLCKVETLNLRCRVCLSCQKASRRARNQRYQKSLKDRSVRRVQPNFTSEEMSTVTGNRMTSQPLETVDSEGVLAGSAS